MAKLSNNGNLKLAVQKEGRLTAGTINFLRRAGLQFEAYKQLLYSTCQNFPLEILFVRDDDIPDYVESGTVELGIVGQNLIYENASDVEELLPLEFAFCSLILAVPADSGIKDVNGMANKTIASSYPLSTAAFFGKENIPIKIIKINGSLEIIPALGKADAIVDISSTGNTLALHNLNPIQTIYNSQATLIANKEALKNKETSGKIEQFMRLNKFAKNICRPAP